MPPKPGKSDRSKVEAQRSEEGNCQSVLQTRGRGTIEDIANQPGEMEVPELRVTASKFPVVPVISRKRSDTVVCSG